MYRSKKTASKAGKGFVRPIERLREILPYEPQSGEVYMNSAMREHFRTILKTWKMTLKESMERTVSFMKETASVLPDFSDRATQEEQFGLELRERDRERQLIEKIDEALRRLDDETYGYCEICGEEIGIKRLEARPTATLCVDCKTLEELREKQASEGYNE